MNTNLFLFVHISGKFHKLLRFPCSRRVHWSRMRSEFTQQFVHFFHILSFSPTNAFSLQFCMRDILQDNAIFLEIIKCTRQLIMIFNDHLFLPFFTTTHILHSTLVFGENKDKKGWKMLLATSALSWKLLNWKLKIAPLALFYGTKPPVAVVYCVRRCWGFSLGHNGEKALRT